MAAAFPTLPDLLQARLNSDVVLGFYENKDGSVQIDKSLNNQELLAKATQLSYRLLAAGFSRDFVLLANFPDHYNHTTIFWACVLAGIKFCPLPPLHPDKSRQGVFFDHLQSLFPNTALLVADDCTAKDVRGLAPNLRTLSLHDLPADAASAPSEVYPQYKASPSDIVALMLTSGSTGNAKAVALTHSNMIIAAEGKSKFHKTGMHSRFFNWIAFDHAACVVEIHIHALFADASQWHISPSNIIARPMLLLELASKHRATYSFCPNFLIGRILRDLQTYDASATFDFTTFTSLVSGGESVPMTTGIRFTNFMASHGAPRNILRAGYGLSETCAGCIYSVQDIPKPGANDEAKDYLPIGLPIPGVKYRIVDSECKPVPVGVFGVLHLRGPIVFKQYYGNPAATSSSFVDDWFITGDLAFADEEGTVTLVGREKDCLNINSVKHLPVDVARYVEDAELDGVLRSNVIVGPLRLPGADTETYAVFYLHKIAVEENITPEQASEVVGTNRAISRMCTIFCSSSPHVVLPLPRSYFVKSALGKLSYARLLQAYNNGEFAAVEETLRSASKSNTTSDNEFTSIVDRQLVSCIVRVFDLTDAAAAELCRDSDLFDMGASSMHLMQLKRAIEDTLGLKQDLPAIELLKRPVIGDLSDYLNSIVHAHVTPEYDPLVKLHLEGSKPPLFLIHPGVGEVLVFVNFAKILGDDRPVYAIRAKGFDYDHKPFATMEAMVESYTASIIKANANGPYYIAGYSFGGCLAFEIAKVLESQGRDVRFVGVLNLPPDIKFRMKELNWVEVLLTISMFLSFFSEDELDTTREALLKEFPEVRELTVGSPSQETADKLAAWMFSYGNQPRVKELGMKLSMFSRWTEVAYRVCATGLEYEPRGTIKDALFSVFCAVPLPTMGTRQHYKDKRLGQWKQFGGSDVEFIDVDGAHYTMMSNENVESFANHMRKALARADSRRITKA